MGSGSFFRVAVCAAVALGVAAPTASAAPAMCGTGAKAPARYAHVIWIVMENKGNGAILGSKNAPFLNRVRAACGVATDYHAVMHPSLPNYIAMTSGGTQGVTGDGPPSGHPLRARSIFEQARSWKTYAEGMPRPCLRTDSYPYAVRHNPATYYLRLRRTLCARDVPLGTIASGALQRDLARNTLPRFSFIVPNLCNDQHDCGVRAGDDWLARIVPFIVRSRAYRSGRTAIFVTWDESDGGVNRVPLFAIAPAVHRGKVVARRLSHYALLRATEGMLGLRFLGQAAHARRLRVLFGL